MKKPQSGRRDLGIALISVLILICLAITLGAAIASTTVRTMSDTSTARFRETAYTLAQNGINSTLFQIEAATAPSDGPSIDIETYLSNELGADHSGTKTFSGTSGEGSHTVTLSDPISADGKFILTSVGKDKSGRTRTLVAQVEARPVQALNYGIFGNRVEFHNHNKVNYGIPLETSVLSNSFILIDSGVSIQAPVQAVNYISPDEGIAAGTPGINPAHLFPVGQQGDPSPHSGADAPVVQTTPPPAVKAFPTFDFNKAAAVAGAGRQLSPSQFTNLVKNAQAYAATLSGAQVNTSVALPALRYDLPFMSGVLPANVVVSVIHHTADQPRLIRIPNAANANQTIPLGTVDGVSAPGADTYEVIFNGNPLADTVLFITNSLTITPPTGINNTLIRIEGSLVVNGAVAIEAPAELLAWWNVTAPYALSLAQIDAGQTLYQNVATNAPDALSGNFDLIYSRYPAIAANGSVKILDDSKAGPTHIEGVVYSVAESHLHRSAGSDAGYTVGSEIGDLIHNCQFFSSAYDNRAKQTVGFFEKTTGRVKLAVTRLESRN